MGCFAGSPGDNRTPKVEPQKLQIGLSICLCRGENYSLTKRWIHFACPERLSKETTPNMSPTLVCTSPKRVCTCVYVCTYVYVCVRVCTCVYVCVTWFQISFKMASKWLQLDQVGPSCMKLGRSWLRVGPKVAGGGPRWLQDGESWLQNRPGMAQFGAKMAPGGPK